MSKLLDTIIRLKQDMAGDWKPLLSDINIYEDVKKLYGLKWTTEFCNRVLAFIVMSYDNQSAWIEIHKDRWDNKYKIASRLGLNIKDRKVKDIVENNNATVNGIVAWFMEYQKDWRWDSIMTYFEYHSEMMRFGSIKTQEQIVVGEEEGGKKMLSDVSIDEQAKGNFRKGVNIEKAVDMRRKGEELLEEIKREYVNIDTALFKEHKLTMTGAYDIESWETFIATIRGKK